MEKTKKTTGNVILFVLGFFAATLVIVGSLLGTRLELFLTMYTENQTKRQAQGLAMLAAEELGKGQSDLEYIASLIESSPDKVDILIPIIYKDSGAEQGLLAIDGHALYGEDLSTQTFDGIQKSFRGHSAITYVDGKGILFTNPVFNGANIKYVLYRFYPMETIEKNFAIKCYDDLGKVCVMTRDGQMIIPFDNISDEDSEWFFSEETALDYTSMHREMEISVAAAKSFKIGDEEKILFEAEVPGTDYLIAGFVPKEIASEGIDSIGSLVMWVFGLLMLLMLIGTIYLMSASIKLKESDEIRKAMIMVEEASKAKSNFLANMSHEIRTPINAVLGMNEMILRESEDNTILTYAENIKNAGKTLLGLINDILDFSKIEAGKIDIVNVDYDLCSVLNELVNMVHTRADDKGLELIFDFNKNMPCRLNGDEVRIKQVITNILTNAVKYTPEGSVTFRMWSEDCKDDSESVFLNVAISDTGIGIREEDLEKLFSEFERIEEKRNRNIEGTGLGLNITKSLLEIMGSSLKVSSVYGKGSTFSFSLKQKVVSRAPIGDYKRTLSKISSKHEKYKEKFTAPGARVLVVDDNPMNLMVFKSLLKKTLIVIDTASDGNEAISLTREKKYDILFLDHMMPGKDGIETLQAIHADDKNSNRNTPSVCLTANAISGAKDEYIKAGFDDYLSKPVDSTKLEDMIEHFLPDSLIEEASEGADNKKDNGSVDELVKALAVLKDSKIDTEIGIKNNGDAESYMALLKMFYESVQDRASEIEKFYENGDMDNYIIKVHALKSSARIIGALDIGEEAQRIESAGKSDDVEYIKKHHEGLMRDYLSCAELLSGLFEDKLNDSDMDKNKPEADVGLMKEVFTELEAAAESMDCDRIECVFEDIEEYKIPKDQEDIFLKIKKASQNFDYDKILDILKQIKT